MTLLEVEQREQRKRQKRRRRQPLPLPAVLNDDQVLDFRQWCQMNAFSPRTGRRVLASGNGPEVVRLSARLIGVKVKANRVWQASRARG